MKNYLIFAVVVGAVYYLSTNHSSSKGAYDADGDAIVYLFTTEECRGGCDETRDYLKKRVDFEEYDVLSVEGAEVFEQFGDSPLLPFTVIGEAQVLGYRPEYLMSAIAAELGIDNVTPAERRAMKKNFTASGEPQIVMYVTDWCGYCKQARAYFEAEGLRYIEYDIEQSSSAKQDFLVLRGSGTPLIYNGYLRMSGFEPRQAERELQL